MGQNDGRFTPDFTILTGPMATAGPPTAHRPIVQMVGSSTDQDLHGDIMTLSALNDMTQVDPNLMIWLNHDYTVPDSVFGALHAAPTIRHGNGVADLVLQVEVEIDNPKAATTYTFIQNGRRFGCSIGCQVLDYKVEEATDGTGWKKPVIHITSVKAVEWSVVGIPANQRSWVENAIRGVFTRTLDTRLASTVSSLFPAEYQRILHSIDDTQLAMKLASAVIPERGTTKWDVRRDVFVFSAPSGQQFASGPELEVPRESVQSALRDITAAADKGDSDVAKAKAAQEARSKEYHIGIKAGGSVTKPSEWSNVPDSEWGDPVNYRYPMPDAAHARNALSRWGDSGNRSQYSSEEQAIIKGRIEQRAKALGVDVGGEDTKTVNRIATKAKSDVSVADDGSHAATTGTHTHAHAAYGASDANDDGQHSHEHTHTDDADHSADADHEHPAPGGDNGDQEQTAAKSARRLRIKADGTVDPALATALIGIDDCADELDSRIDALLAQLDIPDIDATTGEPEPGDDTMQKGAVAFLRRSLRLAADKQTMTDEQMHHAQMAHDALKYLTQGMVCGLKQDGFQTVADAAAQAQQSRDEGNQVGANETLAAALERVNTTLAAMESASAAKAAEWQQAQADLTAMQVQLEATKGEAAALRAQLHALTAQPIGRPTLLNRTLATDPAAVTTAAATSGETRYIAGIGNCRHWSADQQSNRPALNPNQMMMMSNAAIASYLAGGEADVPIID